MSKHHKEMYEHLRRKEGEQAEEVVKQHDEALPVDEEASEKNPHTSYDELVQQLGDVELKANQYWDQILRMKADAENIERRNKRALESAHKFALEKFAHELLPIIDSLELCISTTPEHLAKEAVTVIDGVQLTLKMFYAAMEKFNIKQVNPLGQPFNPEFEQAISVQSDASVAPGTVVHVLQKGYTLNDRVLRPALVTVAKADA